MPHPTKPKRAKKPPSPRRPTPTGQTLAATKGKGKKTGLKRRGY
jgi:hypothetical protein